MDLYWVVLLPIITGLIGYFFPLKISRILSLIVQIIEFFIAIYIIYAINNKGIIIEYIGDWKNYSGIGLKADELSGVMILLTSFLFLITGIFSIKTDYVDHMFLALMLSLEGLIVGIFLSNDLFNIFVLVEISVVIVSILIMFKKDAQAIYDGMIYLLTNTVSMTLFIFGIACLYKTVGVIDIDGIKEQIGNMENGRSLILPFALMITAVSLKSALMPLFSWLPKAHGTPSAPSVVSAVLSGIYVKTGIYLFIRLKDMFSLMIDSTELFLVLGVLTGIAGFIFAMLQSDIKLILAYSTVSQIGLIMAGINMGNENAYWGSVYHIVNHGIFKMTLFLCAGMVVESYHTRDIREIRGVLKSMPVVSVASLMAILGIIGAPFFSGSVSKYWMTHDIENMLIEVIMMILNLGTILIFLKFGKIFGGKSYKTIDHKFGFQDVVVFFGGVLTFLGGIMAVIVMRILIDVDLSIDIYGYLWKSIVFFITLFIGVVMYKLPIKKKFLIFKNEELELSFNQICMMMFAFLIFLIIYGDMATR